MCGGMQTWELFHESRSRANAPSRHDTARRITADVNRRAQYRYGAPFLAVNLGVVIPSNKSSTCVRHRLVSFRPNIEDRSSMPNAATSRITQLRTVVLFMLCLCISSALLGQQDAGSGSASTSGSGNTADSSSAQPITILAVVRDKHGDIAGKLAKDDFTVEEDGHSQTIQSFTPQSDLPLTIGVLVDTSTSQREYFDQEHAASYTFLDQNLRQDKDVAFVLHFDYSVELLQDITASRGKLERALSELQTGQPKMQRSGDPDSGGQDTSQQGGGWPGGGSNGGGRRRGG